MSKCQTVQDENKIEKIVVKTKNEVVVPKIVLPDAAEKEE